ncbi:MAG: nucleotidyl transferase AbiEii/AbiGii toxin family protein [Proteobacteria bacterium]|nr:nucleotidyl transferase AbiEii/AbiGii toxin family protein [Pseudomonadota bacterium]
MEILTSLQNRILTLFSSLPDSEAFYLTGGTALSAFFLKHRRSNDLDFFTSVENLIDPFSRRLASTLEEEKFKVDRARGFHSFVELSVGSGTDSTIIHITLDSPFRFEEPSQVTAISGAKVDSLIDIATNKLLSLFSRAALRDFIDLFFLVKEHFTKEELIEKAAMKDPGFDLYWLGVAIGRIDTYPDNSPDMHLLIRPCSMQELRKFFSKWREEIRREIKG